jgi:hypothetical protein
MVRSMIKRLVDWSQKDPRDKIYATESLVSVRSNPLDNTRPNIRMEFYVGIGGKIAEFVHYDPRTDERKSKIYVISDQQDLNEELTRIISLELMCA